MHKDVLITGAGSGIGRAIAKKFSENNYRVILVGRTEDKLSKVQQELSNASLSVACDIGSESGRTLLKEFLLKEKVNIHAIINNAGICVRHTFTEETPESWLNHFNTNLFGAVFTTQIVWEDLKKNKGTVVNVSSTLGLRPIESTGAYSASKAAMNNWTQTLALEAGPLGIRVNAICPGLVDTPIHSYHKSTEPEMMALKKRLDKLQPLGRVGEPEDIANAVYFAASEQNQWMTGSLIPVDGGVSATTRDP